MTDDSQGAGKVESDSPLDELMTIEQLADRLQMRKSTVGDYRRRGLPPGFKLGRHVRFRRSEVERAIERVSMEPRGDGFG
jgi:excisionase family DNA binding protein